jgi:hypothetical protein
MLYVSAHGFMKRVLGQIADEHDLSILEEVRAD